MQRDWGNEAQGPTGEARPSPLHSGFGLFTVDGARDKRNPCLQR
jgi:hypothetical protein